MSAVSLYPLPPPDGELGVPAAPRDVVLEARAEELRLYRQLLKESRLSVPEWRDDGSGPTAMWRWHEPILRWQRDIQ